MKTITKKLNITIPMTPNFIAVGKQSFPVCEFSDEELMAIGKQWTDELLEKARRTRNIKGVNQQKLRA